jgi:hypothetical protein
MVYRSAFQPDRLSFKSTENSESPEVIREHYFTNSAAAYVGENLDFSKFLDFPEEDFRSFPENFRAPQEL